MGKVFSKVTKCKVLQTRAGRKTQKEENTKRGGDALQAKTGKEQEEVAPRAILSSPQCRTRLESADA